MVIHPLCYNVSNLWLLIQLQKFSLVNVSEWFIVTMQFKFISTVSLDMIHCPLLSFMHFWSLNWLSSTDMGENCWSLSTGQAPWFIFCKLLIYRLNVVIMNFAFWCWRLLFNMNQATYGVWMIFWTWCKLFQKFVLRW